MANACLPGPLGYIGFCVEGYIGFCVEGWLSKILGSPAEPAEREALTPLNASESLQILGSPAEPAEREALTPLNESESLPEQGETSLEFGRCSFDIPKDTSPICSICNDSGCYGFSRCTFCDGIPKPVRRSSLERGIVIEKQTEFLFALSSPSLAHVVDHMSSTCDASAQECMLCATNSASVVLKKCGHGGFCLSCTQKMSGEKATAFCPLCRAPIEAFFEVNPECQRSLVHAEFQVNVHQWTR